MKSCHPMTHEQKTAIISMKYAHIDAICAIEQIIQFEPWTRNMFLAEIARTNALCLTLMVGYEIAGYLCANIVSDELHINNVGVAPCFQRRGYGKSLMDKALEIALKQGVRIAYLEVRESNVAAFRLYEKLGFVVIGERLNYYSTPYGKEKAVLMSITL